MDNIEKHIKVLGVLYIVGGVLFLLPALVVSAATAIPGIISGDLKAFLILSTIGSAVAFLLIALAVPCFIGGYYLMQRRIWARNLLIVLGVINLLNFPVGTAIGIYTLWVLLNAQAKPVYDSFT